MNAATKLALRRFALRWLRKLVDVADDRLHAAEVKMRQEIENQAAAPLRAKLVAGSRSGTSAVLAVRAIDGQEATEQESMVDQTYRRPQPESYLQWEARRSGVAPVSKKTARQRRERQGAAAFDLRYAR